MLYLFLKGPLRNKITVLQVIDLDVADEITPLSVRVTAGGDCIRGNSKSVGGGWSQARLLTLLAVLSMGA